jgi:hypothetical protein
MIVIEIQWYWLLTVEVALAILALGAALWWADRRYERGLHEGVTWPEGACRKLNRRGYDMRYRMDKGQ